MLELGGSLSGEHGDGQSRAELLPKMFGEDLVEAFREFKAIWDPASKMNTGKVVDRARVGVAEHLFLRGATAEQGHDLVEQLVAGLQVGVFLRRVADEAKRRAASGRRSQAPGRAARC